MLKRITCSLLLAPAIVGASLMLTGCETIDEAAEDAQDSLKEAGEEVRDEIDDAATD
jgi:hypothetical protein